MSVTIHNPQTLNLKPFRQRIAVLRAWQCAAIGGCVGSGVAMISILGDQLDLWDARPQILVAIIGFGLVIGAIVGLFEKYSDAQIARSVDRRSRLDDRLTTVFESKRPLRPDNGGRNQDDQSKRPLRPDNGGRNQLATDMEPGDVSMSDDSEFLAALSADTLPRLGELKPRTLYPMRFHPVYGLLFGMVCVCAILYIALDTTILRPASARSDAAKLAQEAVQVQQIARPFIAQADKPGASAEDTQLAHDLKRFVHDLSKARISKQEALIRANQLSEQAQKLEQRRSLALDQSLAEAQSAGAKLQEMAQNATLQKTDAAKLADQADALQKQISALQNQLSAASRAKGAQDALSQSQRTQLENKLAALQKQLQEIKVSQQAAEMLEKLQSMPAYQEAMALLQKLQQQSSAEASGQSTLTPEQLQQIADRLDQLAKQLDTDAKMKAYAQSLLDAAKAARAGDSGGMAVAIANAMGLNQAGQSQDNMPGTGLNGKGGTNPGQWEGGRGQLNIADKSTLLNLKFQDRVITSQKGPNGSETYTEQLGPAHLDAKSGIPYQAMLPKYEKTEESALSKGDIPSEMRTKVRDYFDSLHQGQ